MSIKVSIIIPVYNVAKYLPKCMESVCHQTLQDIEIIAVNDASMDDSLNVLNRFKNMDNRIKIINHTKNTKTAIARNDGLNIARGEYVCFVDGDDYLDVDFCEKLYNLAKYNDADIAKGCTRTINIDKSICIATDNVSIMDKGKFFFNGHLLTGLYNREKLINKHGIKFYIDFFCFQIQVVYFANKIVCDNSALYNYVRHKDSCDSDVFSLNKWLRLNLGHGNFIYDWINTHKYTSEIYNLYLDRVYSLYFYGFNKLAPEDILYGCEILANNLCLHYNCGYDCSDSIKLKRLLFKKHPKITCWKYIKKRLSGEI